ncbi:MAG: tetratricopeptide (TPR) repeat protein [Phycisphaerales bacterium]|jgi:tetratricopeptide (TPR) repeat protein
MPKSIALTRGLMLMLLAGAMAPAMAGAMPQPEPVQPEPGKPEPGQPEPGQPELGQPVDAAEDAGAAYDEARWAKAVADDPTDARARFMLAYTVHASGDLDRAIELHKQAARFAPVRPMALYNLGCAHALQGNADDAFEALGRTVNLGTRNRAQFEDDTDLIGLHADTRWGELLVMIDAYNANPPEKALHF